MLSCDAVLRLSQAQGGAAAAGGPAAMPFNMFGGPAESAAAGRLGQCKSMKMSPRWEYVEVVVTSREVGSSHCVGQAQAVAR
jgi:hypothetical protein